MQDEKANENMISNSSLNTNHELPRFPIRLRWTIFVGLAVAAAVAVLSMIVLDMEREAWLKNQELQASIQVSRLGDELKIPMLAGSSAEVEFIIRNFAKKIPSIKAVFFQNASSKVWSFGDIGEIQDVLSVMLLPKETLHLPTDALWFAKKVTYGGADVATVAVEYSEQAWQALASQLLQRMLIAAMVVILLASVLVYWLAGRMSKPLEELALAARHVADGDYNQRLLVKGNDEFSDAASQFNKMVSDLQHKEKMREVLGRYLNPELVSDVFDNDNSGTLLNRKQEVTVLFADMVSFTAFSESTETEEVVDVLNQHFEIFHSIIDYYGGHVDKYIGDAVMAVFNHPKSHEEHTRHAAMAGIAMTVACKRLGILRKDGDKVSFRVGLDRGHVIIGNIGAAERLEYTVIGDAVNVASRMSGLGEGGEVVLPKETFDAAGDGFSFENMGDMNVKGVSDPLQCGVVTVTKATLKRDINYAVDKAFDATLPTNVRMMLGNTKS